MSRTGPAIELFVHAERDLAQAFGLHHDILKKTRGQRLKRGAEWDLVKSLVCYSDDGREKLRVILKISPGADVSPLRPPRWLALREGGEILVPDGVGLFIGGADSAPNTAPEPTDPTAFVDLPGERIDLATLAKIWEPKKYVPPVAGDHRVLRVVKTVKNDRIVIAKDGDVDALVRVKTSKNFRAGMQIPAEFVDGQLWTFVGRLPRWPGKY